MRPPAVESSLPDELEPGIAARIKEAVEGEVARRIWHKDPTLWGPADQPDFFRLAIEPAGAAVRCDMPRGQRFHYTDACVEKHPQPQAAR